MLRYGEPRLTRDVDITIGLDAARYELMLPILQEAGLESGVEDLRGFVEKTNVLPAKDPLSAIRVDFVFSFSSYYEEEALQRSVTIHIGEQPVRYVSVEDLIIHKIIAARPRGIEDVQNVLRSTPAFDAAYVERWLRSFDQALSGSYLQTFISLMR